MKKFILIIASALVLGISARAEDSSTKAAGQYFAPGWFIGVQGGAQYTAGEVAFKDLISPVAAFNFGYQFQPWFGLRANIAGWQGKGFAYIPNQNWSGYKFNYAQIGVDAMFNICDWFDKQPRKHVVNPYIFVGLGGAYGFNNKEVTPIAGKGLNLPYVWDKMFTGLGRFGFGIDFKVGKRTMIGLELTDNVMSDKLNSKKGEAMKLGNSGYLDFDYNISLLLGVKVALGDQGKSAQNYAAKTAAKKARKAGKNDAEIAAAAAAATAAVAGSTSLAAHFAKAAPVVAEPAEVKTAGPTEAELAAAKAEADRLAAEKAAAEKAAAEKAAAEKAAAAAAEARKTQNIFFDLNKADIRDSEKEKIDILVDFLNADPAAKVRITGHADKATGNSKINMSLSERRAKAVTKALIDKGIDKSRVSYEYKGDTANPFDTPELNRVSICVVK